MPELPEVETTVRGLQKEVVGKKILDVWTDLNSSYIGKRDTVANPIYFKKFKAEVVGTKIKSVERRAKNILIHLDNGKTVLAHMKMTGRFLITNHDKYVRVLFKLSGNKELAFSDPRKFGKITLLDTKTMHESKHLSGIGPEPLHESFTLKDFKERLMKKPKGKIKTVLMDQSVLAGVGNIYSDEILWRAGVHPERPVADVKEEEWKPLYTATKELLRKGIDFGGDSMSDYVNIYGGKGSFQEHHRAYKKKGEKCSKRSSHRGGTSHRRSGTSCDGVIIRKVVNGRSAHFCSKHQTL